MSPLLTLIHPIGDIAVSHRIVTARPLAEQLWHAEIARLGGQFPELEHVTDAELKTLARIARATPNDIGRRVVVAFNGDGIWFRKTKNGLRWYRLKGEQDQALRGLLQ